MPVYEFRCSTCHAVFDERRPMADADAPASCPDGHVGARRLFPVFATTGLAAEPAGGMCGGGAPMAGGCGDRCLQREIPSLRNSTHASGDAHARHPTPHESLNIHRSINDQSCAGNTDERLEHGSRN